MPTFATVTEANDQPSGGSITFGNGLAFDVSCTVYTKARWADSWVEQPKLFCTSVTWNAAPTIPTASLHYRYGRVLEIGELTEVTRPKLSLGGYYVKLVFTCEDGERVWIGFVDDVGDSQAGYLKRIEIEGGIPVNYFDAHGTQTFSCVGIIEALNRDQISTTYFRAITANETLSGKNIAVALSPPHFNPTEETKNRYSAKMTVPSFTGGTVPSRETYIFHASDIYSQTTDGAHWSTRDIVEYLAAYAGPRDYQNKEKIPVWIFYPTDTAKNPLPDYDRPNVDCEGLTLREAFDRLMSAKDSLGYWAWVDEAVTPNRIVIEPYTLAEADYTVAANTLKANAKLLEVINDNDPATAFTVQKNESAYANQVVCYGARRQVVLTLKLLTEIVAGWDSTLVDDFTDYVGPTYDPGVLEDLIHIRDMRNQGKFRALDRIFKLGPTWNFKYPLDPAGSADTFVNDQDDFTGNFPSDLSRYLPFPYRIKLLSFLPLKEGINYGSGDLKEDHKTTRLAYRDIEAYGKKHGETWTGTTLNGKWNCWSKRSVRDVLYDNTDPDYHLEIRPIRGAEGIDSSIKKKNQELAWGLQIELSGADQGLFNASNALGSGFSESAPHNPILPPAQLWITLAMEDDRKICAYHPAEAPSTVDGVRRRYFDFGERFQKIEIVDDAIVGVDPAANALIRRDGRTFIRDDSEELQQVAEQLARYYGTPRNILRGSSRRVTALLWPGQLITKSNPTTNEDFPNGHESICNCVVTEVSISLPVSNSDQPGKPMFSFATSRGEIDPLNFIPRVL